MDDGTTSLPTCDNDGFTAETANLVLFSCLAIGGVEGALPAIVFMEAHFEGGLTGATVATRAAGDPAGYMFVAGAQATQHVVYRGVDNHIYELWWDAAQCSPTTCWHAGDLTASVGGGRAAGDPAGYTFAGTQHVVYRGDDGHIYELWWETARLAIPRGTPSRPPSTWSIAVMMATSMNCGGMPRSARR